jgi:hypothetical protein
MLVVAVVCKTQEMMIQMPERKIKIPFPTATSAPIDATEVPIKESTERWTDIQLEDGTVLRVKPNVVSVVRLDGKYDKEGNPSYGIRSIQTVTIVSVPEHLREGGQGSKIQ